VRNIIAGVPTEASDKRPARWQSEPDAPNTTRIPNAEDHLSAIPTQLATRVGGHLPDAHAVASLPTGVPVQRSEWEAGGVYLLRPPTPAPAGPSKGWGVAGGVQAGPLAPPPRKSSPIRRRGHHDHHLAWSGRERLAGLEPRHVAQHPRVLGRWHGHQRVQRLEG